MAVTSVRTISIPIENRSLAYLSAAIQALLDSGVPGDARITNAPSVVVIEISDPETPAVVEAALAKVTIDG